MSAQQGYLYRFIVATSAEVRALIGQYVVGEGDLFAFGGTTTTLLPIVPYAAVAAVPLELEFGHSFSLRAELRWKRDDAERYDLLLLTEQRQDQQIPIAQFDVRTAAKAAIVLETLRDVAQRKRRWRLDYKEYLARNGAVQFVRYTARREGDTP